MGRDRRARPARWVVLKPFICWEKTRSVTHRDAPLTVLGRQRAVTQVIERGRPIAHVAAEFHIARATLSKWIGRYRAAGAAGLEHPGEPAIASERGSGGADRALAAQNGVVCPPDLP